MNDTESCFDETVTSAIILYLGDDSNRTYFIPNQANDTILVSLTQESIEKEVSLFNNSQILEESTVNETQKIADETQVILCNKKGESSDSSISESTYEEIKILKKFRMAVEEKFIKLKEAITANFSSGKVSPQISSDCDRTNIFVLDVLKDRMKYLETKLLKKVAILNHLSSQLLSTKLSNSQNSENIDKVVNESLNRSNTNECFSTNAKSQDSGKIVIIMK